MALKIKSFRQNVIICSILFQVKGIASTRLWYVSGLSASVLSLLSCFFAMRGIDGCVPTFAAIRSACSKITLNSSSLFFLVLFISFITLDTSSQASVISTPRPYKRLVIPAKGCKSLYNPMRNNKLKRRNCI